MLPRVQAPVNARVAQAALMPLKCPRVRWRASTVSLACELACRVLVARGGLQRVLMAQVVRAPDLPSIMRGVQAAVRAPVELGFIDGQVALSTAWRVPVTAFTRRERTLLALLTLREGAFARRARGTACVAQVNCTMFAHNDVLQQALDPEAAIDAFVELFRQPAPLLHAALSSLRTSCAPR